MFFSFFGSMAFGTFNSMCALVFLSLLNWGTTEIGIICRMGINIILSANAQKILDKMRVERLAGKDLYIPCICLVSYLQSTWQRFLISKMALHK